MKSFLFSVLVASAVAAGNAAGLIKGTVNVQEYGVDGEFTAALSN